MQKISSNQVAQLAIQTMLNNPSLLKQAKLDILLTQKKIDLKEYFLRQRKIEKDEETPPGFEYTWEQLKKEDFITYEHELAHKKIHDKYSIKTRLLRMAEKTYCVETINLTEVVIGNGYSIEEFIAIEKESLMAPHVGKNTITTADKLDILFYEIFQGNIKKIRPKEIQKAFEPYRWEKSS